jgi:hypothetical protein
VGGEPGARVSSEGHADRLQDCDQSTGAPGIRGDQFGQALREDAADACRITADEFPHRQLDAHGQDPPGQVLQAALIPAMHRGRGRGTPRTACTRGGRRELELEPLRLRGHGIEMRGARGREEHLYTGGDIGRPEHLSRLEEERRRDREAHGLSGLQVADQLGRRRLLDRQIGRLGALQDLVHIDGGASVGVERAWPIGHEALSLDIHFRGIHRGEPTRGREGRNPSAERLDQLWLGEHDEGVRTRSGHRHEGVVQLLSTVQLHDVQ